MTVASTTLRLHRRTRPHIPLRYMWGFQQFTLLRSVATDSGIVGEGWHCAPTVLDSGLRGR